VRGAWPDAGFDLELNEMLSGRHLYSRQTAVEVMTAILEEEPPEPAGGRGLMDVSGERGVSAELSALRAVRNIGAREPPPSQKHRPLGPKRETAAAIGTPRRPRGRMLTDESLV
jgi:hypothetical protein